MKNEDQTPDVTNEDQTSDATNEDQMLDAANAGDKPLPVAQAAEAIQTAQQAIQSAEIAALQDRLEEAERKTQEATRLAMAADENAVSLREELARLTKRPKPVRRGKQADLLACNQKYMTEEEKRRKDLGTVEKKVADALKGVFNKDTGRPTKRRVQKMLRAPANA